MVKRDSVGSRSSEIGALSGISAVTTPPSIGFSGDNLQVTFPAYEFGYIQLTEQVSVIPTTFSFNSTHFPFIGLRRK